MKTYWDTSGLINAAVNPKVLARLAQGEHTTRTHTLAEFFGIMTGRGIRWERSSQAYELKLTGEQAAEWLQTNTAGFDFHDPQTKTVLAALAKAQARNVAGPHVHDYLHAIAADEAGAKELVTRNESDFSGLTAAKIVWP